MENDKIIQYIKNGDERGLLDKLRAYSFNTFNKQIKNLLKILLVLIEEANDKIAPHQFFYKTVVNVLPEIIVEKEKLVEFLQLLKTNSLPPYQQTSFVVREFIIGVEDRKFDGAKYEENEITPEQISEFKIEMIKINVSFLRKAIEEKLLHEQIMAIFYSCVERLEAERKIIINKDSIESLREYLKASPEEYLKNFIRPLYSGGINNSFPDYFLHVPEPFYLQIFDVNFSFESFLELARDKKLDEMLVNDIEAFYKQIKDRPLIDGNKTLMLKCPARPNALELKSKLHKNVRPELK